ncbi:LysR family transcriptional regulator [Paraburkholderia steynii]|uniref:LysR family transcriptional regulator n=1 Tax=Paraburkholderia steynii TaxID=1245441 RepID=A0A4R0XAH8_9BURK|nr:LysR family transcriptional regulator [Paraburkholderia steynii]
MDLESLKIFCVVAAELSITRAAARLGRVQSNVTTRIQQLEADVGVELFVRTGKRMSLSTAGECFLGYAQRLLALEEEARHVVTGGLDGGALRIGCMESTAASRLPVLLAGYHTRFPATRLEVTTGPSRQLLEQVRTGRLDCAFLALPPGIGDDATLEDMGLLAKSVWREELLLLLPPGESSVRRAADVQARSLAAFSQGCTYRAIAEERLGIADTTDWNVQEMGSYHAMIACVCAGACVALLPKSVLELAKAPQSLKTLHAGYAETCLIWRNDYDVPAFQNLAGQLRRI